MYTHIYLMLLLCVALLHWVKGPNIPTTIITAFLVTVYYKATFNWNKNTPIYIGCPVILYVLWL